MEGKGTRVAKIMLKEEKVGELSFLHFKTHHKVTVTKAVQYWQKDRHMMEKQNRESRTRQPHTCLCSTDI